MTEESIATRDCGPAGEAEVARRPCASALGVFAPLEALFNQGALAWWETAGIVLAALGLGYWGMWMEETR
jgi:hypothetical protein